MSDSFDHVFFTSIYHSENQQIDLGAFGISGFELFLKREDQIHPLLSGNKFRKLKYNLQEARKRGCTTLVTFGGAYSNHLAAVAAAGAIYGFKTIGFVRGEELQSEISNNPTLKFASEKGMELRFISRTHYREKHLPEVQAKLCADINNHYLIPEGGTNALAVKGCSEILMSTENDFQYICVPVGTGGTLAGLAVSAANEQQVLGFSALKGTFQQKLIHKYVETDNFTITDAFSFGGYAKIDSELIRFMNDFYSKTNVLLDPIYTGKMMFGIFQLMEQGYFRKNTRILAIHTGGTQGIPGMNQVLKKKNLPQIEY